MNFGEEKSHSGCFVSMSRCIDTVVVGCCLFVLSLVIPGEAFAVSLAITKSPSSISNEEFVVGVYIDGPEPGTNYLRVDLYKEGTSDYFGETFNGSSWYGGSNGLQYYPVTISPEGTASAEVRSRMGTPTVAKYPGPGWYKLRVRRYTSSGSQASDSQTPVDIQITYSTPPPSPPPTQTASPTVTPTQAPTAAPISTSTPRPTLSATATSRATKSPSPSWEGESQASDGGGVLGLGAELAMPSVSPAPEAGEGKKFPVLAGILATTGLGFIGTSVYMFLRERKKGYTQNSEEAT